MAKQITEELKNLFTAQGVTANGDTIADVLKSGFSQLNSATVDGNLIADIIAQCAETGTFPGGGAAPTYANEITWDGDTTGRESITITTDETEIVLYKISDNVLPAAFVSSGTTWGAAYTYAAENDAGSALNLTTGVYSNGAILCMDDDTESLFVCAYHAGAAVPSAEDPGAILPSAGTWVNVGEHYIASVTATPAG